MNRMNMIHNFGIVEDFELLQVSQQTQCPYCMKYSMKGVLYCDCGTCLILSEQVRKLNKKQLDDLTIPFFTIKRGTHRGYRYGQCVEQKSVPPSQRGSQEGKDT